MYNNIQHYIPSNQNFNKKAQFAMRNILQPDNYQKYQQESFAQDTKQYKNNDQKVQNLRNSVEIPQKQCYIQKSMDYDNKNIKIGSKHDMDNSNIQNGDFRGKEINPIRYSLNNASEYTNKGYNMITGTMQDRQYKERDACIKQYSDNYKMLYTKENNICQQQPVFQQEQSQVYQNNIKQGRSDLYQKKYNGLDIDRVNFQLGQPTIKQEIPSNIATKRFKNVNNL